MSPYLVLLILDFFPARLATLPYNGLDSNVTQLLANLLTKPSVFYYLLIISCNLVSIKLLLLLFIRNLSDTFQDKSLYKMFTIVTVIIYLIFCCRKIILLIQVVKYSSAHIIMVILFGSACFFLVVVCYFFLFVLCHLYVF